MQQSSFTPKFVVAEVGFLGQLLQCTQRFSQFFCSKIRHLDYRIFEKNNKISFSICFMADCEIFFFLYIRKYSK